MTAPTVEVKFVLEHPNLLPKASIEHDVCYDLKSAVDIEIPPWERALVSTGIRMELPSGNWAEIKPRSGLATKKCIDIGAGVIDPGYRGTVQVLLINNSNIPFVIQKFDRIAQLAIHQRYAMVSRVVTELDTTARGTSGFGSTTPGAVGDSTGVSEKK